MSTGAPRTFGAQLKALREAAGYTQEELATIAGLSVHAVSALERGERRRPQVETVRALSAALDLAGAPRDAFVASARASADTTAIDELSGVSLPLAPTSLLGRDGDVQALGRWLADPAARLITVTGPGGVGKTRLAIELAHAMVAEGAHRVRFVPLASIRTPELVAPAIGEALGLSNVAAADLAARARAACADQRTLLVLDNFEHVIDAAPLVAELLASVASLRMLITSRALLRVRGEREYALGPLALDTRSEDLSPADLARMSAVRLFVERVRDVQPDFHLTSANGATIAAICRRLDALPLALELAAAWMRTLPPEDLLRRLEHDVLFSNVGPRDLPERQRTMNATVAWSYHLLDADEQRAFRRFAVLPGLFPVDAAAAILAGRDRALDDAQALHATAGLMDKSLLVRADGSVAAAGPLYRMLETVRAYAALELGDAGERADAMEGLVRYCARQAALAEQGLCGPAQVDWLNRVREDLASYRAALTWLVERERAGEAAGIAWALLFFWVIRGHAAEGVRWYDAILQLPSLDPAAEATSLVGAALMRFTQGDLANARTRLARARALACDVPGQEEIAAQAETVLGHVEHAAGNMRSALDWFTRSEARFGSEKSHWGAGHALSGLAWVAMADRDLDRADRLLDEATVALQHVGPWFLSLTRYLRAVAAVRRGDPDRAIRWVHESLTHIRQLQDKFAFVYALVPLASAAVLKGDAAWAARIIGARDAITETTGATFVDPSAHDLQDEAERVARALMGPEQWAMAYADGRKTSIDALLKEIDEIV